MTCREISTIVISKRDLHSAWFPAENSNNTYDYQYKYIHEQCSYTDPPCKVEALKHAVYYYKKV